MRFNEGQRSVIILYWSENIYRTGLTFKEIIAKRCAECKQFKFYRVKSTVAAMEAESQIQKVWCLYFTSFLQRKRQCTPVSEGGRDVSTVDQLIINVVFRQCRPSKRLKASTMNNNSTYHQIHLDVNAGPLASTCGINNT